MFWKCLNVSWVRTVALLGTQSWRSPELLAIHSLTAHLLQLIVQNIPYFVIIVLTNSQQWWRLLQTQKVKKYWSARRGLADSSLTLRSVVQVREVRYLQVPYECYCFKTLRSDNHLKVHIYYVLVVNLCTQQSLAGSCKMTAIFFPFVS